MQMELLKYSQYSDIFEQPGIGETVNFSSPGYNKKAAL